MSRRRKHGDSPGAKTTPCKTVAAEECSSVVEPGRRRLRSARGWGLPGAGEVPSWPRLQQEQPPAAASCSKSNPEERDETPKRMLKVDLLSSTFSSPNDPDGQNDIFWDQNSPLTKQLGKGRKKQIYTTDTDEISHIVNRIAPQDEKPTTDSMLGMWIGATAIPCTPNVAKGKLRAKISCTKLKTQNQEEELMKLAKQFDKNMEELDVIEEQDKKNHDLIQMISEIETLNNYNVQIHSSHGIVSEIDNAIMKKTVQGNTKMAVVNDQNSSQKPFDQNAEAAFNAIFDGSTQTCSGPLSQDLPDAFVSTSNTTFGKKSSLKEGEIITNKTLVTEKLLNKTPGSLSPQDAPILIKPHLTTCTKEPEASDKHTEAFTTSDFEDDWENLLGNEPFTMQNFKMPEPFPSPKTSQVTGERVIYTFSSKNDKSQSTSLDAKLRNSKILLDPPSKIHNKDLIDARKYRFSPNLNDKSSQLSSTGNKKKLEKSFDTVVIQEKIQDCTIASNPTNAKENILTEFTSNVNATEKKLTVDTRYSNEQKNKPVFNQSFKAPVNIDPLGDETYISNTNHINASKLSSFFDDWNDPSFANEILKTSYQLENTWEADDVDDDLLYQACDNIERLTQQEDIRKDSKTSESVPKYTKHGAKNFPTTFQQESRVVLSKHLNLDSISVQTSSLTNNSKIDKSIKMKKGELCTSSPTFLGPTANLTTYSKNSKSQINNLHVSWNNIDISVQENSYKSVCAGSSNMNVNSDHMNTEMADFKKKLSTHQLSCRTLTDESQNNHNETVRFSKYTFTKVKNSQILSHFDQNCITGSIFDTKITQSLQKNKIVNPLLGETVQKQSLAKLSEPLKQQSSKEEEEKNRKYSPEEIQRKRQEALVRRMARARASSINAAPT